MALVPFPGAAPAPDPDDESRIELTDADELDDGAKMSFLEHLDELRKRLIHCAIGVAVGIAATFYFHNQIYEFVFAPTRRVLPPNSKLIFTEPGEAFSLHLQIALITGIVVAAPYIMYQVWLFIAPGLYSHEKKFAIPFVFMATFFFVSGVLFSHFIAFPWTWAFFASFSTDYVDFMPKVSPVFSFYAKMLLGFGLIFQMPTLVFFLARFGLVTARFLIRYFKYAVLVIFIVAAVLTPGTDVVSQLMMAVPMLLLYGISILIAWIFGKKKAPADN